MAADLKNLMMLSKILDSNTVTVTFRVADISGLLFEVTVNVITSDLRVVFFGTYAFTKICFGFVDSSISKGEVESVYFNSQSFFDSDSFE